MLWPDARIVEPCGYRMRFLDLSVAVHQQIGTIAVQNAGSATGDRCRVLAAVETASGSFHAVDFDAALVEEGMEQAHGIRTAADAGQPPCRCNRTCRAHWRPNRATPRSSHPSESWSQIGRRGLQRRASSS